MVASFTLQDIAHTFLAVLLFPLVTVFPGYVIGWILDIFSFRQQTGLAQYVMGTAISTAAVPMILFLGFYFVSNSFGVGIMIAFFITWIAIQIHGITRHGIQIKASSEHKLAFVIGSTWVAFSVFLLVDIQFGQSLYFNAAAHDFTTRVSLIEAVTRTGIPPINPSYYPGQFERITELYYFWYLLASVIDMVGGQWVDARTALFAGITWSGLSLVATVATYLHMRGPGDGKNSWRSSAMGAQLLAVSGLDFIPVTAIMIAVKTTYGNLPFDGRIEGWNPPIMSWLNALTWVPNHVTGMIACMIAMLAILSSRKLTNSRWAAYVLVAGAALGSAFGLSIWVTFTFGVFMAAWVMLLLFRKEERRMFLAIATAGVVGLILASPFLLELLRSGGKSGVTGAFPISFYVRHFSFVRGLTPGAQEIAGALLLPLNYFLELGFFFVVAVLWIRQKNSAKNWQNNDFWKAEILLLTTTAILLSFVKSTVIAFDDLGIRGWLLVQFILVIWAVDLFHLSSLKPSQLKLSTVNQMPYSKHVKAVLRILLVAGVMTTTLEASVTRFWAVMVDRGMTGVPNEISPDTNLGMRTYDARLAYEYIRDHTPANMIVQNNPTVVLDRPSGLYGTRQMVIADRTAYGVSRDDFAHMSAAIGEIFLVQHVENWVEIDERCNQYSIEAIVVSDIDPLWASLEALQTSRSPIYINPHYAVFRCGNHK